jgi:hypothetical protein
MLLALIAGCSTSQVEDGAPRHDSLESIVRSVEVTRGVRAKRPIDARIVTPEEMRQVIADLLASQRSSEEIAAYEYGLATVGLWPRDRPLVDEYLGVMGEEVSGLYVPERSALFIVNEVSVPFSVWLVSALAQRDFSAEFVLSHELVHLLQHQEHPGLFEPEELTDQDDAALALQAAFEGEAMFYGMLSLGGPLPEPAELGDAYALAPVDEDGALANAPALIRGLLGFPYLEGYRLAWQEGPELLSDPPASTEQVMQGGQHESFEVFDLSAVSESLPDGCEAVHENTVGALQLSILFGEFSGESSRESPGELSTESNEESAWLGWDGDRYLAARCGGNPALLWLSSWDSEEDAFEFAVAYRHIAPEVASRAGLAELPTISLAGRLVTVQSPELALRDGSPGSALEEQVARTRVTSLEELREAFATR